MEGELYLQHPRAKIAANQVESASYFYKKKANVRVFVNFRTKGTVRALV